MTPVDFLRAKVTAAPALMRVELLIKRAVVATVVRPFFFVKLEFCRDTFFRMVVDYFQSLAQKTKTLRNNP